MVIFLAAKGLTTRKVSARLAEVYGAEVSRQTVSTISDKVNEGHDRVAEPTTRSS